MIRGISQEDADKVFEGAVTATWTATNLGLRTQVHGPHGGWYWLTADPTNKYLACIDGYEGWGGSENVHADASQAQHRAIAEALRTKGQLDK
jgi:hypothetical protein